MLHISELNELLLFSFQELILKANNDGDEEFLAFAGNKVDVPKYAKQESEEQQ